MHRSSHQRSENDFKRSDTEGGVREGVLGRASQADTEVGKVTHDGENGRGRQKLEDCNYDRSQFNERDQRWEECLELIPGFGIMCLQLPEKCQHHRPHNHSPRLLNPPGRLLGREKDNKHETGDSVNSFQPNTDRSQDIQRKINSNKNHGSYCNGCEGWQHDREDEENNLGSGLPSEIHGVNGDPHSHGPGHDGMYKRYVSDRQ